MKKKKMLLGVTSTEVQQQVTKYILESSLLLIGVWKWAANQSLRTGSRCHKWIVMNAERENHSAAVCLTGDTLQHFHSASFYISCGLSSVTKLDSPKPSTLASLFQGEGRIWLLQKVAGDQQNVKETCEKAKKNPSTSWHRCNTLECLYGRHTACMWSDLIRSAPKNSKNL